MGATDFTTTATGRNAQEAYRAACEEATYEHGHDPYNGTISTTSGVRELPSSLFKGLRKETRVLILECLVEDTCEGHLRLAPKHKELYQRLRSHGYHVEKWGPALALCLGPAKGQRGHKLFIFVGLAAC